MATPSKTPFTKKPDDPPKTEDVKTKKEKTAPRPADKADTIEPNPVEAGEPYPTGAPADPDAVFEQAHGYKRPKE